MSENFKFYPEERSITINPLEGSKELRYILQGIEDISRDDIVIRYAFSTKWNIDESLKRKVKGVLKNIIDVSSFDISPLQNGTLIAVPLIALEEADLPVGQKITVPVLVKLITTEGEDPKEFKCLHKIVFLVKDENAEETEEEYSDGEEDSKSEENAEKEEKELLERDDVGLYSGLLAVDYGTSNSTVAVRDPAFASEEVRGQLGTEQWNSLCEWIELWLIKHLSSTEPTDIDKFVESLTTIIPESEIPECGTPKSEISTAIKRMDDRMRVKLLGELIGRLSKANLEGGEGRIIREIAPEIVEGFEAVIDSKNLRSQRYFVLELDRNIGEGPISSALQIVSVPNTDDVATLEEETKIDMGARVGLLLHNASRGEIDIRQFILSSKRYFGSDEILSVVPAESDGEVHEIPTEILCKLTYKELFDRAVADIHRRADMGLFEDGDWPGSLVATFPTSYPAALRRRLREVLTELNVNEIDTRFDEATSAALYYIWREIGADPVCGMHGLMARSKRDKHGTPYQNILLYDLGGGTTDIALIQLIYEELEVFRPTDDRGNGGCYFRIIPRLLGTTGHRHLGGDLITLWIFRFIKSKIADLILTNLSNKNIEPPLDSPLNQILMDLPEDLMENVDDEIPKYRPGSLMDWTSHPSHSLRVFNQLNEKIIDVVVPTRFAENRDNVPNFFTLWEITEEAKKTLGTPIGEHFGTCLSAGLPSDWPNEIEVDSTQIRMFLQKIHPWLIDGGLINEDDLRMEITQDEMNNVIKDTVRQSVDLAVSLAKSRLISDEKIDKIDRLILCGLSCNMKVIQVVAKESFLDSEGIFDYDPVNVKFDRDSAKTSVVLGACIGRYMESVRVDPYNEKTKQMLRDGYDQIELVIENLFLYLPCRLAYDSLVAMVTIFNQGQELNVKSYFDDRVVARSSIMDLRPLQEKFWIYRIDFEGAEPQYIGLVDSESLAMEKEIENFKKFREEYVVGFETDAEIAVRCFFLPKGQRTIVAKDYVEANEEVLHPEIVAPGEKKTSSEEEAPLVLTKNITMEDVLEDITIIKAGTPLNFMIEYPDGSQKACCISRALHRKSEYRFRVQDPENESDEINEDDYIEFQADEYELDEATLLFDETGRLLLMTKCLFDIELWADVEYVEQKVDINFDPFCGQH